MFNELTKLTPRHYYTLAYTLLSTLFAGTLIIYYFDPNLFKELPVSKLILLAVSITFPVTGLNCWFILKVRLSCREKTELMHCWLASAHYSSLIIYALLVMALLFGLRPRTYFYMILGAEVLAVLIVIIRQVQHSLSRSQEDQKI